MVRGSVGNRAAVFALESLGRPVWAVPTINLAWHPGHGPSTRIIPADAEFASLLSDLSSSEFSYEAGAILTGYMATTEQVRACAEFVKSMRSQNADIVYYCDPVIGDANGLYVKEPVARAIAELLVPQADVITPNRFELEWLVGRNLSSNSEIVQAVRSSIGRAALVTSAFGLLKGSTGNLYVEAKNALLAEHKQMEDVPNGVGDLTAALFLGRRLGGQSDEESLKATTQSVFELLLRTRKRGADELTIESDVETLRRPTVAVQVRRINVPN